MPNGKFRDKRVGVLMGGPSGEREVSLRSGTAVEKALRGMGYDVIGIDAKAHLPTQLKDAGVQVVYNALHGTFGEDGVVQGILEAARIPYAGSGVLASALTMDKTMTKRILLEGGVPTPAYLYQPHRDRGEKSPTFSFPYPVVVKPNREGSSLGISICRQPEGLEEAIAKALEWKSGLLMEEFIPGRELTVGVIGLDGQEHLAFPLVEIVPKGEFYDYQAKYTKGASQYFCPAEVTPTLASTMQEMAVKSYSLLQCRGAVRVDFRLNPQGQAFVIEINTSPGMTELSLLPMGAKAYGLEFAELVELNLESASLDISIHWG